ncbi:MAG TPA: MFS transporter, partial [Pseudomonas sp.]|nr:MFS transporter [Pseudomonas sp.]
AFLGACLPAWVAAIALFSGLNAVALMLMALSSVVLLSLYRIPRQLG